MLKKIKSLKEKIAKKKKPSVVERKDAKNILDKAYEEGYLTNDEFAKLMRTLLVSENGYVLDTGSALNVNAEIALRLAKEISDAPGLWEKVFMVA